MQYMGFYVALTDMVLHHSGNKDMKWFEFLDHCCAAGHGVTILMVVQKNLDLLQKYQLQELRLKQRCTVLVCIDVHSNIPHGSKVIQQSQSFVTMWNCCGIEGVLVLYSLSLFSRLLTDTDYDCLNTTKAVQQDSCRVKGIQKSICAHNATW